MKTKLLCILSLLFIQILCEVIYYNAEKYYHNHCCRNFHNYLFMKSSFLCKRMKNVDSYINPMSLTNLIAS